MKKYLPYIKKYWYSFLLGPLFMTLEAVGEILIPSINADIVNKGAANGDVNYILKNGLYMVLLAVAMLIFGVLGANFSVRGSTRMSADIRAKTFRKMQSFSFSNIDDFTTGSLITRITNDVTQVQSFTQTLLRGMFRSPIMLVGALIMSFRLNRKLAWVILAVMPLLAAAIALIILISSPRYAKMQQQIDALNINTRETVTNQRVIKSFVRGDYEKEKFRAVNNALVEKSTSALKAMMLLQPISALAVNFTTLLVVWLAGKQVMVGGMEVGTLMAFITYLAQVLTALNFLANIVLQGVRAAASDRRISEVLSATSEIDDRDVTDRSRRLTSGKVEFQNVSFRYYKNSREKVLDRVTFAVQAGETVGIVGPTGSGKTTLVSLIARLYDTDEGAILLDGTPIRQLPLSAVRDGIAMVQQQNTLFTGTIAENLRWGKENATDGELEQAAKIACAHGFVSAMPQGYQTELTQGATNLSGGQKQRLCIARALLKNAKIIVLDDSTSAVDTATDASIRRALRQELSDVTTFIIAQRINSVIDADKILVLDAGRAVGFGSHEELLESCPTYREIYWSQNDRKEQV